MTMTVEPRTSPHHHVRELIQGLFTLRESPARLNVATTAGLAIALPIVVLTLVGRPDLGLMASPGGFLSLYLPYRSIRDRARWLPLVALTLLAGVALSVATARHPSIAPWALGLAVIVVTSVGFALRTGPPGAVFFIIISGVTSQLVAPPLYGGRGLSPWLVTGMITIGMGAAYLVIIAPLVLPHIRDRDRVQTAASARTPMTVNFDAPSRIIIARIAIAVLIASVIGHPMGVHRYYWVLLTIVAILQNGHRASLTISRSIQRVLGTTVGLLLFAVLAPARPSGLWLALVIGFLQFTVELLVTRNYGLALLVITPLAMTIASQGHTGDLGSLVSERLLDTALGAGIALSVLLITKIPRWLRPRARR